MSSWSPDFEISISDSEDESDQLLRNVQGRECILFIVDAKLYSIPELLENALLILRSAFLSGLLVNDKDLIGLIFVNTMNSPEPLEPNCLENIVMPEKCAVFLPPRQLNTFIVKNFLGFVETAPAQFGEIYGSLENGESCNFSHVLRLCLDLVKDCNHLVSNTTIVFLTHIETPHDPNSEGFRQVLQKAADLKNKDVEFHLIPMIDVFNYDTFYKEFICLIQDIDIDCFQPPDPKRIREMLANRKFKQHYVRRSLGHFKFSLGPNLMLSAQYFNYYQKQKKPTKMLLQRTDSAIVRKHRITQVSKYDAECDTFNERDINIKNAWYEINLGYEKLRLSYEQVNRIRNIHPPGMVLLGFKPMASLKDAIYSKTANFMYPDDLHIEGSKRLFRALWQKCLERQKIALCLFMCKRKSMPRYVALVPIEEGGADSDDYQFCIANSGFKIVYLSCSSYIRNFNLSDWNVVENQANDEEVAVCEKLMKKFRLDYNPDILCDPTTDQLQSKLLSLAFNVNYETLGSQYFPKPEDQDVRIAKILPAFKEIFGEEAASAQKRCLDDKSSTSNRKKAKTVIDIKNKDCVMQLIKDQALSSCSKDQLMQILEEHFDTTPIKSTKKQQLMDMIYQF